MKKLIFLTSILFLFSSCEKKEDIPLLTGSWNLIFTFDSDESFHGTLTLTHNSDNSLTGNFVISDNSGFSNLLSTSKISGNEVIIDITLGDYTVSYKGTVNAERNSMTGNFYSYGVSLGTWVANKSN